MADLPEHLTRALDEAAATPRLLVVSDFDGTLAPIVDDPTRARPLPRAAEVLIALADLPSTVVALVSGRALAVLREYSGMPSTVRLVGSHGAEFDVTGGQERSDSGNVTGGQERSDSGNVTGGQERSDSGNVPGFAHDVDRELLERITAELDAIAAGRPGVTVEPKPASVALHVRNASAADGAAALEAAREVGEAAGAEATSGKSVLEFAVISTDKGEAVDILREQTDATTVTFFGDDVTDEKAFRRMRAGDVGVKVGPGETLAGYRVESPEDVATALAYLLGARRDVTR